MNIVEALKRSKETGEKFYRPRYGLISWHDEHCYHGLHEDDILADDWEPVIEGGVYRCGSRMVFVSPVREMS